MDRIAARHPHRLHRPFLSSRRLFSSSRKRDYYEILGLKRDASKADIKKSYFELAKKYHPDVNKDKSGEAKFKEVTEAYECLENDEKRKIYDNYGHVGVENMSSGGGGGGDPFAGFGGFRGGFQGGFHSAGGAVDMEDLFSIFGQAFGGMQQRDLQTKLRLSFFEAINGCRKDIEVEYYAPAPSASRGRAQQRERKKKRITVDIPPGVDTNMVLRLQGEGVGEGRNAGDLNVEIEVEEDSYFKRSGNDIVVEVPVPVTTAMLGGAVDVLTLDGIVSVKLPAGTQPNAKLSLRDKGVKYASRAGRQMRGSQLIVVKLQVPTSLTERQRELLAEFQKEEESATQGGGGTKERPQQSMIDSAWKRLKSYMGAAWCEENDKKKSSSSSSSSASSTQSSSSAS